MPEEICPKCKKKKKLVSKIIENKKSLADERFIKPVLVVRTEILCEQCWSEIENKLHAIKQTKKCLPRFI